MSARRVLDASTFARAYFSEPKSDAARVVLASGEIFSAPELILLEVAAIAHKKHREGNIDTSYAGLALDAVRSILDDLAPDASLADDALHLALEHGFSAYDASYLALAIKTGAKLVTVDERLGERALKNGFGEVVILAL